MAEVLRAERYARKFKMDELVKHLYLLPLEERNRIFLTDGVIDTPPTALERYIVKQAIETGDIILAINILPRSLGEMKYDPRLQSVGVSKADWNSKLSPLLLRPFKEIKEKNQCIDDALRTVCFCFGPFLLPVFCVILTINHAIGGPSSCERTYEEECKLLGEEENMKRLQTCFTPGTQLIAEHFHDQGIRLFDTLDAQGSTGKPTVDCGAPTKGKFIPILRIKANGHIPRIDALSWALLGHSAPAPNVDMVRDVPIAALPVMTNEVTINEGDRN